MANAFYQLTPLKSIALGRAGKGFVEPEIRKEGRPVLGRRIFRELDKEMPETKIQGVGIDLVELLPGEITIESLCLLGDDGNILGHETQRKLGSEFYEEGSQSIEGVLHMSRKDEMTNEHSFFRQRVACVKGVQKALLRNKECSFVISSFLDM